MHFSYFIVSKVSTAVLRSKDDYLLEASNKLSYFAVYETFNGDPWENVDSNIKSVLPEILNCKETRNIISHR